MPNRKFVQMDEETHKKFQDLKRLTNGVPMKVLLTQMVDERIKKERASIRKARHAK